MYRFRSIAPEDNHVINLLNSDRLNENLKGKVKYVIWAEAKFGKLNPLSYLGSHHVQKQLESFCQYNLNGQKIDYRQLTVDGFINELIQFTYNEKKELVRIIIFDEDENINFSINYKYNLKGQLIEEFNDVNKELFKVFYDTNGLVKKIVCKAEMDEYRNATYIIKRDSKKPINIIEVIKNKNLKTKYNYDKNGNIIKIESFQGLGGKELCSTKEITYDNFQNIIKSVFKNKRRTTIHEFDYIYDDQKNWINSSFYSDGELLSRATREIGYY